MENRHSHKKNHDGFFIMKFFFCPQTSLPAYRLILVARDITPLLILCICIPTTAISAYGFFSVDK